MWPHVFLGRRPIRRCISCSHANSIMIFQAFTTGYLRLKSAWNKLAKSFPTNPRAVEFTRVELQELFPTSHVSLPPGTRDRPSVTMGDWAMRRGSKQTVLNSLQQLNDTFCCCVWHWRRWWDSVWRRFIQPMIHGLSVTRPQRCWWTELMGLFQY